MCVCERVQAAAELAERKKQQAEQASILKSPLYSEVYIVNILGN